MAANVNSVILAGNLTKDPELRHTPGGTTVGQLRMAVNERFKDGSGEWTERANYFDVTAWGKTAENCAQYLSRGSAVLVEGRLRFEEWEAQDGSKRSRVSVTAQRVHFLGSKGDGGGSREDFTPRGGQGEPDFAPVPDADFRPRQTQDDDDSIPFLFIDAYKPYGSVVECPRGSRGEGPSGQL